jgi:hypothetical protein
MTPYYEQDGIVIYHGDCRDVAETLPTGIVDLVLTDPPYGQAFVSGHRTATSLGAVRGDGVRQGIRSVRKALNDLQHTYSEDCHFLVFCHWESWPDFYDGLSHLFAIRNALIWSKGGGGMGDLRHEYAKNYEVILFGAKTREREISGKRDGAVITGFARASGTDREHPTEKPVPLLRYLAAKHVPAGGLVLDPFAGVGTTLIAARTLGRRAIGIELEERYCEIAARRLEEARAQHELPMEEPADMAQGHLLGPEAA